MNDKRRLLSESEAGAVLRLTTAATLRLAKDGTIPAIALPGGEFRFDPVDLWKWVESRKQPVSGGTQ